MSRRRFVTIACIMVLVALVVRVRNAIVFPPLLGYDGFGHFTYIWYVSKTWHVPLPTTGWSFFHPPLYYVLMAGLWNGLSSFDPFVRLHVGCVIMGILSLTHAAVVYVLVRRYVPGDRLIHLLAPGLMLFLPVLIYSAPFLGNEGLSAVLCSLSILALLNWVAAPSWRRSVVLGVALGLSMLTKVSGLAVVGGAFAALAMKAPRSERPRAAFANVALVAVVMLSICGWYYGRNIREYGTPLKLSRDEFIVKHVEDWETKGKRDFLEYVLFDPMIFRRPQWPRELPLIGEVPPTTPRSSMRESVLTGLYANTWYEGFNWWILPPVYSNDLSRRSGQLLLTFGIVPTVLILIGLASAITRTWREGWDDEIGALLLVFASMAVIFVQGTRAAPMHLTVKATYLMPVTTVFGLWFAFGLRWLRARRPGWLRWVAAECAVLAVASATVFSYGLLFKPARPMEDAPFTWGNIHGIVYYAAGWRDRARELFRASADENSHLGFENLAAMAFEEGRPLESLYLAKSAAQLAPQQSFGTPPDRAQYDNLMQAEYRNSMAVIYHSLGWDPDAEDAATDAVRRNVRFAEAQYNLGVLKLLDAERAEDTPSLRTMLLRQAQWHLGAAAALDPGLHAATTALASTQAIAGDCDAAEQTVQTARKAGARWRRFPVETGEGIQHSAAIGRHKNIDVPPFAVDPEHLLADCRQAQASR